MAELSALVRLLGGLEPTFGPVVSGLVGSAFHNKENTDKLVGECIGFL
jgi:hypothetical protein